MVATPIGNLGDFSQRAMDVLRQVDLIAAEDTRHSRKLLHHFAINKKMVSCHEHNEAQQIPRLLDLLAQGQSIALLTDAGTPLVSDPGYRIVGAAIEHGIAVTPIPGPCAAIAALSVSGLPTDRFLFVGFPPGRQAACRALLESLAKETATLVFYESPRRLVATLQSALAVFGPDRSTVVARELTKVHETVTHGRLRDVLDTVSYDATWQKGELVLMFAGLETAASVDDEEILRVLKPLLAELPLKQAVGLTVSITGARKNDVYETAVKLSSGQA